MLSLILAAALGAELCNPAEVLLTSRYSATPDHGLCQVLQISYVELNGVDPNLLCATYYTGVSLCGTWC